MGREEKVPRPARVTALKRGTVDDSLHMRFRGEHPELNYDNPKVFDNKRQQWSTFGVRNAHGRRVKDFLKKHGILGRNGKSKPEMLKQIFNLDEAPNPVLSGVSVSGVKVKHYGGGGGSSKKRRISGTKISENITINPLLSWDENVGVIATQIIFSVASQTISKKCQYWQNPIH